MGGVPEGFLRPKDAAEYLGIGETTLDKLRKAGEIHSYRLPGCRVRVYAIEDLREFKDRVMRECAEEEEDLSA